MNSNHIRNTATTATTSTPYSGDAALLEAMLDAQTRITKPAIPAYKTGAELLEQVRASVAKLTLESVPIADAYMIALRAEEVAASTRRSPFR